MPPIADGRHIVSSPLVYLEIVTRRIMLAFLIYNGCTPSQNSERKQPSKALWRAHTHRVLNEYGLAACASSQGLFLFWSQYA